jgi:DHA1 family bicyclomycin/chloramphenicol resistance-like MFS transporter
MPAGGLRARVVLPIVLASVSMLGPFSIDTAFPAFVHIQQDFGVGIEATQQLVSAYLLSFGLMSVFHGPISDAVGRKPVMVAGLVGYLLASLGCALAPNMAVLLVFRVLQGLLAGGGVIVSRTVIRDLYEGPEAQRLMSRVVMIFGVAPAVAPIVGGWILQLGPWRWIFWFLAMFSSVVLLLIVVVLPETHPPERRQPLRVGAILRSLAEVGRSRRFQRVAGAAAFAFGGQFLYIGAAAIFVVDLLGKGETDFWIFFVPMITGIIVGSWVSSRAAGRISGRRLVTLGYAFALGSAVVNAVLMAVPATARLPWAVLGPMLIAFGIGAAYPTTQLTILDTFPRQRGAATSMSTAVALLLNGLTAGALAPIVTASLLTLALSSAALVAVGLVLWLLHLRAERVPVQHSSDPKPLEPVDQM